MQGPSHAAWEAYRRQPGAFYPNAPETAAAWGAVREAFCRIEAALRDMGYAFWCEDEGRAPVRLAPPDLGDRLEALDARLKPLPGAVTAFALFVGEIDFRQAPDQIGDISELGYHDPFCFDLQFALTELEDPKSLDRSFRDLGEVFLDFAPDAHHKADVSGGADYAVALPATRFDPMVDLAGMSFLTYVQAHLERGGFLGALDRRHRPDWEHSLPRLPLPEPFGSDLRGAANWS